jgi:hypothetical protein
VTNGPRIYKEVAPKRERLYISDIRAVNLSPKIITMVVSETKQSRVERMMPVSLKPIHNIFENNLL